MVLRPWTNMVAQGCFNESACMADSISPARSQPTANFPELSGLLRLPASAKATEG
jgi:hypothetical protein